MTFARSEALPACGAILAPCDPSQWLSTCVLGSMKLVSGTPLWSAIDPVALDFPPLARDALCDVLIIGGGITGALVAYRLSKEGRAVILIDCREVGHGSTAASTGLLQYEVDTPLSDLIRAVGEDHAVRAYRRGLETIGEIESLIAELGGSFGFCRQETLYFASHWWHARRLRREYKCRRAFGFDVDYLTRADWQRYLRCGRRPQFARAAMPESTHTRLLKRLLAAATKRGLVAHAHTCASHIQELPGHVLAHTSGGSIQANTIVYAAGYESDEFLANRSANMNSTYAVASQPRLEVADVAGRYAHLGNRPTLFLCASH